MGRALDGTTLIRYLVFSPFEGLLVVAPRTSVRMRDYAALGIPIGKEFAAGQTHYEDYLKRLAQLIRTQAPDSTVTIDTPC